ncbi:MAG: N-acetyltransferase family protein [Clostridia bacterium]|nr:N-acetyltransferase family protein [Clostridia bacterium]
MERVTTADTEDLLKIYAPYVTDTAITFEYDVPSFEEFKGRIEDISSKYPYIKAVQDGKTVGYAYATAFKGRRAYDWSVETTIYMDMNEKRKGVGRLLYNELEKLLKGMGVINMNACIALPKVEDRYLTNDSVKYHERMGFTEVGVFHSCAYKFDTWYDMIWMEKMIGEHRIPQEDVRFGQW